MSIQRLVPLLVLLAGLLYVGSTLRPPAPPADAPDHVAFGRLPVLVGGRIKPLDTVARASLLQFQGRQTVRTPDGRRLPPSLWIADALLGGTTADDYQVFEILHPEVLALLKLSETDGAGKKRFAYKQIEPALEELERQAELAQPIEAQRRTPFQREVIRLRDNLGLYARIKASLVPPGLDAPLQELTDFQNDLPVGIAALRLREQKQPHNEQAAERLLDLAGRFEFMARNAYLLPIPPDDEQPDDAWQRTGEALLDTFRTGRLEAHAYSFAGLAFAWRAQNKEQFDPLVGLLRAEMEKRLEDRIKKVDAETRFKAAAPFYSGMVIFVAALLLAVVSWLKWPVELGLSAYYLNVLGFVLMTAGIATRMWLEGRPPVTNLYSSAIFVAWGSVGLCLVLEKLYPRALASAAAGIMGFSGLIIAHHLSLSGDTLEMMRAVLDSNFWLATHVVVITIGYSATYLAGFLAALYIIRGFFTASLDRDTASALERMVYGIICFATLFSLVGTILGGIWADQSWGRFWGWDPKENGALIIVIWNAIILHARWGRLCGPRGLMALAVFGNIVTSWSWFGTNMLGVGLHSYGFMEQAFLWLVIFASVQISLIFAACFSRYRAAVFTGLFNNILFSWILLFHERNEILAAAKSGEGWAWGLVPFALTQLTILALGLRSDPHDRPGKASLFGAATTNIAASLVLIFGAQASAIFKFAGALDGLLWSAVIFAASQLALIALATIPGIGWHSSDTKPPAKA